MDNLTKQAQALVATRPSKWTISNTFNKHLENLELGADEVDAYQAKMQDALANRVIPAYESYLNLLLVLSERAPEEVGMWSLPEGLDYYDALLRKTTTTELTAEEIHQIGLERV